MIKLPVLTAALVFTASSAIAQTPPPPPPAAARSQAVPYVKAAGMSDLYEIKSSKLALEKSSNPAVRQFAQMMIIHHQQTTQATMTAAKQAGLSPVTPSLAPAAQRSIAELQAASGADFDRLYISQQLPAHEAALDLHQAYAAKGDKAPLKASAKAAVPIVEAHIAQLRKMKTGKEENHAI